MKNNLVFKFSRPNGVQGRKPSKTMSAALRQLSESDEVKSFAADAQARGRKLIVQVFHSAEGHPILIHLGVAARKTA